MWGAHSQQQLWVAILYVASKQEGKITTITNKRESVLAFFLSMSKI